MIDEADAVDEVIVDPREAAESAGLVYVTDETPGITRYKRGKGFGYRGADGKPLKDAETIARINALAIPPAYTDVWICPDPAGHMQATGRDAKGRKQYRYHPTFREVRDGTKYAHMLTFAQQLPQIRATVDKHMRQRGLTRERVLATVVHLLETTMIRVGNADYVKQNQSHGLTTLEDEHVDVHGSELNFHFKGKSGKEWKLSYRDRRVAKIVKASQDLPGEHLFQYLNDAGEQHAVTSGDVNAYLREISGTAITAKDFRTWTGTVLAAMALAEFERFDSQAAAKRNVRAAIEKVSARLGNTPAVCRKCYIHPEVIDSYMAESLVLEIKDEVESELRKDGEGLSSQEALVLAFLHQRLEGQAGDAAA